MNDCPISWYQAAVQTLARLPENSVRSFANPDMCLSTAATKPIEPLPILLGFTSQIIHLLHSYDSSPTLAYYKNYIHPTGMILACNSSRSTNKYPPIYQAPTWGLWTSWPMWSTPCIYQKPSGWLLTGAQGARCSCGLNGPLDIAAWCKWTKRHPVDPPHFGPEKRGETQMPSEPLDVDLPYSQLPRRSDEMCIRHTHVYCFKYF